jgi:hypothetical protein
MSDTVDQQKPETPARFAALLGELNAAFPKARFEPTGDAAMLAAQISRHVPEAERARWFRYLMQDAAEMARPAGILSVLAAKSGVITLAVAALIVLLGILAGILSPDLRFREAMGDPDIARGVITFLFAFGTISIALLIAAASYWAANGDGLKERFGYAKDILMVLIGILGTIIGFYFGTSGNPAINDASPQEQTDQPAQP